jgi:predicted N-formylglutamate amidohydrolase
MRDWVMVTCEHGGNRVPRRYARLFGGWEHRLATHRGLDFGALLMAREIAKTFRAPLVASTVTRLLVDLNRSVGHRDLYSPASRRTSIDERDRMLRRHYVPYRAQVEGLVAGAIGHGGRVVHVSSHSFTPRLHGEVRRADVGLLYDPSRPGERGLVALWRAAFERAAPELRVRRNYPYLGKLDGLTSHLRHRHPPEVYVGIELELNQAMVLGTKSRWTRLRARVIDSLRSTVESKPWPDGYRIHLFGPNPR